jgi:hypothetical protein
MYFEVIFGPFDVLWEVREGFDETHPSMITVTEYKQNGPDHRSTQPNFVRKVRDWAHFIEMYHSKLNRR